MQQFQTFLAINEPYFIAGAAVLLLLCLLALALVLNALLAVRRSAGDTVPAMKSAFEVMLAQGRERETEQLLTQVGSIRAEITKAAAGISSSQSGQVVELMKVSSESGERIAAAADRMQETLTQRLQSLSTQQEKRFETLSSQQEKRLETLSSQQEKRFDTLSKSLSGSLATLGKHVSENLSGIREENGAALRSMRETVEEKLQKTLETRISTSFRTVEGALAEVQKGLGEMREMAKDVDGLRKVLANVKTRGNFGELQLRRILEDILVPGQYAEDIATVPGSRDRVEFAIRLPGRTEDVPVWLPIDAKFPLEPYEHLLDASERGDREATQAAGRELESRILKEADTIRSKYVSAPHTTDFAILYLPSEGLWAEVVRRPGLLEKVSRKEHVMIAGPTILATLLNSLQLGFRTLAIERKSTEVWNLLNSVRSEFGRFSESIDAIGRNVASLSKSVEKVQTRTRAMNRCLQQIDTGGGEPAAGGQALPPDPSASPGESGS